MNTHISKHSGQILEADEPLPYSVINEQAGSKTLLICEHASNVIPKKLDNLGLPNDCLQGHMAWDIGAGNVAKFLSEMIDSTAILANYSRLVIDLNRRVDHPTSIVTSGDGVSIPGNIDLTQKERSLREGEFYSPFHDQVAGLLQGFLNRDIVPAIISIHSFTQSFYNLVRPWEIGVLWAHDYRLAGPVIDHFRNKGFTVGDNEPYDGKILRGTTVDRHGDEHGLPNVLIEIRNDLIDTEEKQLEWAKMLAECFENVLQDEAIYKYYEGPKTLSNPEREHLYFEELIERAKRGE